MVLFGPKRISLHQVLKYRVHYHCIVLTKDMFECTNERTNGAFLKTVACMIRFGNNISIRYFYCQVKSSSVSLQPRLSPIDSLLHPLNSRIHLLQTSFGPSCPPRRLVPEACLCVYP